MTGQMGQMTEQMARGELSRLSSASKWLIAWTFMSTMMRRMSWLAGRPSMKPAEQKKQMDQMRKQMDEMMRDSKMMPGAK